MEQVPESRTECKGSETLLSLIHRLGLGQDLLARLRKPELGALRSTCQDGRTLVNSNLSEISLVYPPGDDWKRKQGPLTDRRLAALLASQWSALLYTLPLCTALGFIISGLGRDVDAAQQVLEPFRLAALDSRPPVTAHIARLRLCVDFYHWRPLAASFPESIAHLFPSLLDLQLDGMWMLADARGFYAGLARHLPRLQRLHICCCDGLEHIALLPPSLTQLRELSLGHDDEDAHHYALAPEISPATAAALASFPQLRELRIFGLSPGGDGSRNLLRHGLARNLERLSVGDWYGTHLVLTAVNGDGSSDGARGLVDRGAAGAHRGDDDAGGSGGRTWDAGLAHYTGWGEVHASDLAALVEAEVPLRRLSLDSVGADIIDSPLLQDQPPLRRRRYQKLEVRCACLVGDDQAARLGELLGRGGAPEELNLHGMRRRSSLAHLNAVNLAMLAPRLTTLELGHCPALTPAKLASALAALPLVKEVNVVDCERFASLGRCGKLVGRLLDLLRARREREGSTATAVALRRLLVRHGWRALHGRSIPEEDEGADEDEGALWMADNHEEDDNDDYVGLRVREIVAGGGAAGCGRAERRAAGRRAGGAVEAVLALHLILTLLVLVLLTLQNDGDHGGPRRVTACYRTWRGRGRGRGCAAAFL